ncbi:MAG: alpha/beta fold hydrolase, partial [Woeseiaceae bacterium]
MLSLDKSEVHEWYERTASFDWKDNNVAYRHYGDGPPMLLIHGFPTAGCDWSGIGATLSGQFKLIAPD